LFEQLFPNGRDYGVDLDRLILLLNEADTTGHFWGMMGAP
jgi:hypothetical protein